MSLDTPATLDVEELRSLVATALELPVDEVTDTAGFVDDLGVDSLMSLEIAVCLEQRYGTKISDEEMSKVTSFQAVLDLMREKLSASVGS
jgi:acyl carrier protein